MPPTVPQKTKINGADLLDRLRAALVRYVVLPSAEAADAITLWIAATHAQTAWEHAPRLVLKSPEKRCGKSRCQDVIAETCHRALITVNATVAAIVRSVGDNPPTLIVDEADTIFRWDITSHQLEAMTTFAMACLASIGDLPDTIEDRTVVIRMRRRAPGEQIAPYRTRRDGPHLNELRDELADWVGGMAPALHDVVPEMPVEDRAADTWEPLVAIADAAGGHWPDRARSACLALTGDEPNDGAPGTRLLADLHEVWKESEPELFTTTTILDRLKKARGKSVVGMGTQSRTDHSDRAGRAAQTVPGSVAKHPGRWSPGKGLSP